MASGRVIGTCSGRSGSKYSFWVEWSSSIIAGENASNFHAVSYVQRNDGYADSAYNDYISKSDKKMTVNGELKTSVTQGIDTRNSKKFPLVEVNKKIQHDQNGYATVSLTASFPRVSSNLTGGSLSGKVSLDHIDRQKPVILSISTSSPSATQIKTNVQTDVAIDGYWWHPANDPNWRGYDGNYINGLTPNTTYSFYVWVKRKGENLYTQSWLLKQKTLPIYISSIGLSDFSLKVGIETVIPVNIQPTNASIKKLSYTISDPNICEIRNGRLYAKQPGTVTLTAKTTDGSNITETATVTCIQPVLGITINQGTVTIPKGGYSVLNYSIIPANASDKSVTITVEDDTIAQASGNTILGIETGVTKVNITTSDGGLTAFVFVTVQGDYNWYQYDEYIDILNYWDVQNIYNNMQVIASLLVKNGYFLAPLELIQVSYETEYSEMFDILQNMEYNLDRLSDNECYSVYYVAPKTVGEYGETKANIFRWVQVLNDMHDILLGDIGKWQVLECTDGIPTIEGNQLVVRGELVG